MPNIQGRITAKVYADFSWEVYAYEPSTAHLKSRTNALAQRTDYGYAKDDRLTSREQGTDHGFRLYYCGLSPICDRTQIPPGEIVDVVP